MHQNAQNAQASPKPRTPKVRQGSFAPLRVVGPCHHPPPRGWRGILPAHRRDDLVDVALTVGDELLDADTNTSPSPRHRRGSRVHAQAWLEVASGRVTNVRRVRRVRGRDYELARALHARGARAACLTERGELAVRVREPGACPSCGHDVAEIRVEDPR